MSKKKIGIISDIHATDITDALDVFEEEETDFLLVNGDLIEVRNYKTRKDDLRKTIDDLSTYDGNVYVIPGNHDLVEDYIPVMEEKIPEYDNIFDLSDGKVHTEGEFAIIPYGGSQREMWQESFMIEPKNDIEDLVQKFNDNRDKKIIFQTHDSPFRYGDLVAPGRNVGSRELTSLIEGDYGNPLPYLSVSGHIHQNHMYGPSAKEIPTKIPIHETEKVSNLALNAAPYVDGRFAIVESIDDKISYTIRRKNS